METAGITDAVRGYTGDNFFLDHARLYAQSGFLSQWVAEGNNPLVDEAWQYFSVPRNWHNLAKILEIIAKDMGQKENNGALPLRESEIAFRNHSASER